MPQKTWAVGEEVLAADFNTYVQQQTVPQFTNNANRDTWTSAPNGALAVTTDTNTIWQRVNGVWVDAGIVRIYPTMTALKAAPVPANGVKATVADDQSWFSLQVSGGKWFAVRYLSDSGTTTAGGQITRTATQVGFVSMTSFHVSGNLSFPASTIGGNLIFGRLTSSTQWDAWAYQIASGGTWANQASISVSWTAIITGFIT